MSRGASQRFMKYAHKRIRLHSVLFLFFSVIGIGVLQNRVSLT